MSMQDIGDAWVGIIEKKKKFIRNSATLKSYWFELLGMVVEN